jgi:hypothetical protein
MMNCPELKIACWGGHIQKKYNRENAYDSIKVIKKKKIKVYSEDNAYKLMKFIGEQFKSASREVKIP